MFCEWLNIYVILCFCDSPVITDAKSFLGREKKKIILLEGRRLVAEAIRTSQPIKFIFFTDAEVLAEFPVKSLAESGVTFCKVKNDHMNLWSDTVAPQGIMGNYLTCVLCILLTFTYQSINQFIRQV